MPWPKAKRSRHKDPMRLRRYRLTMFKAVSDHAKRQYLGLVSRFLFGCRIDEDARKRRHFGDPAPVLLTLNLDPHDGNSLTALHCPLYHRRARAYARAHLIGAVLPVQSHPVGILAQPEP